MTLDTILDAVAAMAMVAVLVVEEEVEAAEAEAVVLAVDRAEATTTTIMTMEMAVMLEVEAEAQAQARAEAEAEAEAPDLLPTMQMDSSVVAHQQIHQNAMTTNDPWHCEQSIRQDPTKDENSTLAQTTIHAHLCGQTSKAQPQLDTAAAQTHLLVAAATTTVTMSRPFVNVERTVSNVQCERRVPTQEGCSMLVPLAKILAATTLNGWTKCKTLYYMCKNDYIPPPLSRLFNQTHT